MRFLLKPVTAFIGLACLGCAADDPIPFFVEAEYSEEGHFQAVGIVVEIVSPPLWEKVYPPEAVNFLEPEQMIVDKLTGNFEWMGKSGDVAVLQQIIGVEADGVYGPRTRESHLAMLQVFSLPVVGVPDKPAGSTGYYSAPDPVSGGPFWDNVERWRPIVSEAVFAWGGDEADVHRFLRIMQCESAGIPTAKNPSSSASGLMQQLARYWPERAASAGMPGADVFDPYANVWVSAWLALAAPGGGWSHWVCK